MIKWVITCEHGGNKVPREYLHLFHDNPDVLCTHRAVDIGSEIAFSVFSQKADYSRMNTFTRLLIELNRSLHHPKLFSEFSNILPKEEKHRLKEKIYNPYRQEVEDKINNFINGGHYVVHISIHSFTPELNGQTRNNDIGLLYDPGRSMEKKFCVQWKKNIKRLSPGIKVRYNYPYLGKADGFVTYLRSKFVENYVGIELEINQKHENLKAVAVDLLKTIPQDIPPW